MILKSPHPDIDIPDNISLPQYIFGELGPFVSKPAIVDGLSGQSLTYGQLYQGIQSFARGLKQKGLLLTGCRHSTREGKPKDSKAYRIISN